MRHGQSLANQQSLIVSSPEIGVEQFGLTDSGARHVKAGVQANRDALNSIQHIFASDFLRTRETAQLVGDAIGIDVQLSPALRERGFGEWEGASNENYEAVWRCDAEDASHQKWRVESVQQVAQRMVDCLNQIDQTTIGQFYLLVSHGDPLQILLTAVDGQDLRTHRQLKPLETAEIRLLVTPAPQDH